MEELYNICRNCEIQIRTTDFSLAGLSEEEGSDRLRLMAYDELWEKLQELSNQEQSRR